MKTINIDNYKAQTFREILTRQGWIPFGKIIGAEYWLKGGLYIVLQYYGDKPADAETHQILFATAWEQMNGDIVIQHDSGSF